MSTPTASDLANKLVDFDLDLADFNKITAFVCNLLDEYDDEQARFQRIECKIGDGDGDDSATNKCTCHRHSVVVGEGEDECTFCEFLRMVRQENSKVRVTTSSSSSSKTTANGAVSEKDLVHVNYKTLDLSSPRSQRHMLDSNVKAKLELYSAIVEWSEYQVWRTPYVLIGYASCASQADLHSALRSYEQVKKKFAKTLVTCKLFVDFHLKHEQNDEFRNSLTSLPSSPLASTTGPGGQVSFDATNLKTRGLYMQRQHSTVNLPTIRQEKSFDRLSLSSLPNNSNHADSNPTSFDYSTTDESVQDALSLPPEPVLEEPALNDDLKVGENDKIVDPLSAASETADHSDHAKVVTLRPKLVKAQTIKGDETYDEIELERRLKAMKNEIVYLDFLFSKSDLNANLKAIIISERNKIASTVRDCVLDVYKKLSAVVNSLSTSDEKQLNQYSEILKTPVEKDKSNNSSKFGQVTKATDSMLSFDSTLSIKIISRKTVAARMYKYKADLYMILNQKDLALQAYAKAHQNCKKEQDLLWSASALLGQCISSYFCFYAGSTGSSSSSSSSSSIPKSKSSKSLTISASTSDLSSINEPPKLSDLKSSLKRRISMAISTDSDKFIITPNEYAQNFQQIISTLSQNELTRYISFEYSLMLAKFLIRNQLRSEAIEFLSYLIYTSLPVREEFRIRRYLEVGYLYEKCDLRRLSVTYKWIGSSRIFQIIDKLKNNKLDGSGGLVNKSSNEDIGKNPFLKCLINKCIFELKDALNYLICRNKNDDDGDENVNPLIKQGFPMAKKYLLTQLIRLLNFNESYLEAAKFSKYLLHEMHVYLNEYEMQYLCDLIPVLISTSKLMDAETAAKVSPDPYDIKFFKIPFMNSFQINDHKQQEFTRTGKIVQQPGSTQGAIYIHRYENPLLKSKGKKVLNVQLDDLNRLDIEFTNPLTTELVLTRLSLVVESPPASPGGYLIDLHLYEDPSVREFKIPAKAIDHKISTGFTLDKLGSYKITGYEVACFDLTNRILFSEFIELNRHGGSYMRCGGKEKAHMLCKLVNKIKQSSFDILVSPKLSEVKAIQLVDTKSARIGLGSFLEPASNMPTLECFLGLRKDFEFKILFADDQSEIMDISLNKFSNDRVSSFGIQVDFKKTSIARKDSNENDSSDQVYGLVVDSSSFCSDSEFQPQSGDVMSINSLSDSPPDTCAQFMFEVKYTNASCRAENICQYFKRQMKLTFRQAFLIDGLSIQELDENSFKFNLRIKNLIDKKLSFVKTSSKDENRSVRLTPVDIDALGEANVSLVMQKFELADLFKHLKSTGNESEVELVSLLNEFRLNDVRIKLDDSDLGEMFKLNLKKNEPLLVRQRHHLFKCPVKLTPSLKLVAEQEVKNFYNLTIVAWKPAELAELDQFTCTLELSKKLGHCFLASRPQSAQMPKAYLLFKEINLISDQKLESAQTSYPPIHLQLELRTEAIQLPSAAESGLSIKWNVLYAFGTKRVEYQPFD